MKKLIILLILALLVFCFNCKDMDEDLGLSSQKEFNMEMEPVPAISCLALNRLLRI